jgi:histidine triad (HIT) family protein
MSGCLFCAIVSGEVPCREAGSSELTYAFYDINPVAPIHVLVVPRQHIANADEVRPEHAKLLAEMFCTAQAVARSNNIAENGYRLVFNVGPHALNSVPHLHMHVLGGAPMTWPPGTRKSDD